MIITRTANAGVLLEINDTKILIDGVSGKIYPYIETPENVRQYLLDVKPDAFLYTHAQTDHFDSEFVQKYKNLSCGPVLGPQDSGSIDVGCVNIRIVNTRHIGKCDDRHVSFVLKCDNKTIWFMGDASPSCLKSFEGSPDVLIAPFAYANTSSAYKMSVSTGASHIIIVHLPPEQDDVYLLKNAVVQNTANDERVHIPSLGEKVIIY